LRFSLYLKTFVALEVEVRPLCALGLAVVLVLSPSLVAQQSPATPVAQAPQALGVIQAALSALAGPTVAVPASILASGTYTRTSDGTTESYPVQIKALGLTNFRWDTGGPQGTATVIVAGLSGWFQGPSSSRALALGETFGRGIEVFPLLLLSKWLNTAGVGMTWVGPDTVSGQSVNHVTILPPATASAGEPQQLAQCELYVNPQTGVPVRIRVYQHPIDRRASVPLDLDFTDYQAVSGLLFPMAISFSIAGQPMSEIHLQSIALNASVSASDFTWSGQ